MPQPLINQFTASSVSINKGESVRLTWQTANASSVSLNQGVGAVVLTGFKDISPAATATYTLTAQNSQGQQVTQNITVTVNTLALKDGTLVLDHSTIYIIEFGKKRPFASLAVFTGLGFKLRNVIEADVSVLSAGEGLFTSDARHTRGVLVESNGTIYFLGADLRYAFPSAEVFFSWGHSFVQVVPANEHDLALPIGPVLGMKQ